MFPGQCSLIVLYWLFRNVAKYVGRHVTVPGNEYVGGHVTAPRQDKHVGGPLLLLETLIRYEGPLPVQNILGYTIAWQRGRLGSFPALIPLNSCSVTFLGKVPVGASSFHFSLGSDEFCTLYVEFAMVRFSPRPLCCLVRMWQFLNRVLS